MACVDVTHCEHRQTNVLEHSVLSQQLKGRIGKCEQMQYCTLHDSALYSEVPPAKLHKAYGHLHTHIYIYTVDIKCKLQASARLAYSVSSKHPAKLLE